MLIPIENYTWNLGVNDEELYFPEQSYSRCIIAAYDDIGFSDELQMIFNIEMHNKSQKQTKTSFTQYIYI